MKKFVKKATAFLMVAVMLCGVSINVAAATDEVFPLRQVFEAAGAEVLWDSQSRTITISLEGAAGTIEYVISPGSQVFYLAGEEVQLHTGVMLDNGVAVVTSQDLAIMLGVELPQLMPLLALLGVVTAESDFHLPETVATANLLGMQFMDIFSTPGMIIAVVDAEGSAWVQGLGYANTADGVPVTGNTLFNLASISKPFTAIAVMQLVEQGIIDLDTPVVEYLPEFSMQPSLLMESDYRNITVRMLLSHASGITNDFAGYGVLTEEVYNQDFMNNFVQNLANYNMSLQEATMFSYANNAFTLLGILVAHVMGHENYFEGFVSHMHENIFAPLGMDLTTFEITEAHMPFLALPYDNALEVDRLMFHNALPTAGIFSSGYDMARFMFAILDGGEQLLAPEYFAQMFEQQDFGFESITRMLPNMQPAIGFVYTTGMDGFVSVGHGGNLVHYHSNMQFCLDAGLGVFVSVNSIEGIAVPELLTGILLQTAILEKTGALDLPQSTEVEIIELPVEELEKWEGFFVMMGGQEFAEVRIVDDVLHIFNALGMPEVALAPLSDGSFVALESGLRFWFDIIDGERVIYLGEFASLLMGFEMSDAFLAIEGFEQWVGTYYAVPTGYRELALLYRAVVGIDENGFAYLRLNTLNRVNPLSALAYYGDGNFGGIQFVMIDGEAEFNLNGMRLVRK